MLKPKRKELLHDWKQGDYIEGGVLEGRIDWDKLEEMEAQAKQILTEWANRFDMIFLWSGGFDSLVLKHMIYDLGLQDEYPAHSFITSEFYQHGVDFIEGMSDRWGFDSNIHVHGGMDIDWVAADPDNRLFPDWETKDRLYNRNYRNPAQRYIEDNELDFGLNGVRNEHGHSSGYIETNRGIDVGKPIWQWPYAYVLAYCDKYSLPVPEAYRELTNGATHPWHRELTHRQGTDRSVEHCWFIVRECTARWGYASYWEDHILEYFPEGEEKAAVHASNTDKTVTSLAECYNTGADSRPVPAPVGPGGGDE